MPEDNKTIQQILHQRAEDGYPEGADRIMREEYGQIPWALLFQSPTGYEIPSKVYGWQWSVTFNRWTALVTFDNGWRGFTWPKPQQKEPPEAVYVVKEENTLGYVIHGLSLMGVLASNKHGHHPNGGGVSFTSEQIRLATEQDFLKFRVHVPPNLVTPSLLNSPGEKNE